MRPDRGHAAVEFALAIGVLMLPVAVVVMSFAPWLETRVTAEAAAAEGARAAVLGLDLLAGEQVLTDVIGSSGVAAPSFRLGWCGADASGGSRGSCALTRGSVVEVDVEIWTPLFSTPWGSVGGLWVGGHHAEPIDLYRSLP